MIRRLFVLLLICTAACAEQTPATAPGTSLPRHLIADATRDYRAGFYWLPPMVSAPLHGGAFDAALEPTVEICELVAAQCGPMIAVFTPSSGPDGETVRLYAEDELYQVNWHTNRFGLSTSALYRVSIRAGSAGVLLGFADVQPVNNGSGLRKIDTDEYIGLVDGRTLPIKFRIESGIVGSVSVEPAEATLQLEGTQQFAAVVRDLHEHPVSASVVWSSSDERVATVDATGLVTAVAQGTATISATSDRITGTATIVVEGGSRMLTVGADHGCLLERNGIVYCWGEGNLGQLGDGAAVDRLSPVAIPGERRFRSVDAGQLHTCALASDGLAYCWGANTAGQIGAGTTPNDTCTAGQPCRLTPVEVSGARAFVTIASGHRNTCALTEARELWCWGEGAFGALGNGTTTRSHVPVPVSGGHAFAAFDVGLDVSCGVTTEGVGYCWGSGSGGKLGNNSTSNRNTPTPISGGLTLSRISVGNSHTCALTPAGEAWCWGVGTFGRLGNGGTTGRLVPVAVSGGHVFASISAGFEHTCAVTTDGRGYCWGGNVNGKLGDGTQAARSVPTPVTGDLTFASISAGTGHSCGITVEGQTYCWGSGFSGQLGNGTNPTATPVPVPISSP